MFYNVSALATLSLALLVGSPAMAAEIGNNTQDGKVISVTGEKLVMTGKGGNEEVLALTPDCKVCLDGKAIKSENLKAGMKIRVTIKSDNKEMACRVEALENNEGFSTRQDGKVVSITGDKLVMTNKEGKEVTCTFAADATFTLDGKACKAEDLKAGTPFASPYWATPSNRRARSKRSSRTKTSPTQLERDARWFSLHGSGCGITAPGHFRHGTDDDGPLYLPCGDRRFPGNTTAEDLPCWCYRERVRNR